MQSAVRSGLRAAAQAEALGMPIDARWGVQRVSLRADLGSLAAFHASLEVVAQQLLEAFPTEVLGLIEDAAGKRDRGNESPR